MSLVVKKFLRYGWRVNARFGHVTMGNIVSWEVVDAETGRVIEGGISGGNNTCSDTAQFPYRWMARAWLDGFNAARKAPDIVALNKRNVHEVVSFPEGLDYDGQFWFKQGALDAVLYRKGT